MQHLIRLFKNSIFWMLNLSPWIWAFFYILAFVLIDILVTSPVRYYNFSVFLALSGSYFAWLTGGRKTFFFVTFFNLFMVFLFSKLLWSIDVITSLQLYAGKSFLTMYALVIILVVLVYCKQSPADQRLLKHKTDMQKEKERRENLEFAVATKKLTSDFVSQANLVKDEMMLMENAWRSNVHSIINDLPLAKEKELYRQIVQPFQDNIIRHLRELQQRLSFEPKEESISDLVEYIQENLENDPKAKNHAAQIEMHDLAWREAEDKVFLDRIKFWDVLINIIRNSQTALDLQQLKALDSGAESIPSNPVISIIFDKDLDFAYLTIKDNAGGVDSQMLERLYQEPVLSEKRQNRDFGQGSLFVKFFATRMNIAINLQNIEHKSHSGLAVTLQIPLLGSNSQGA